MKKPVINRDKDYRIMFQNQSHLVQKYFESCGVCPSLLMIAHTTDLMLDFVMNGETKENKIRFDDLMRYIESLKDETIILK